MPEKLVATGFSRATELTKTSPSWFSCGPSNLGDGLDQLWSTIATFGGKNPDQTGPQNTRCPCTTPVTQLFDCVVFHYHVAFLLLHSLSVNLTHS